MPSLRDRVIEVGLVALSTVGLTLVACAWPHPDMDSSPGLAMLIIGAVGIAVRCVCRAGTAGQAQRREILGTIEQVIEGGGLAAEAEALRREREQLAAERAQFEAERTQFYARAVAETLHALGQNGKGHVKLLLPKPGNDRPGESELCRSGANGERRISDRVE